MTYIRSGSATRPNIQSMRIQVDCRRGASGKALPWRFVLGARVLHVVRILSREAGPAYTDYTVSVADGRHFVLRHNSVPDDWELVQARQPALIP